ncbi:MAG: ribosomal protein [Oscillospiraceae bacterium]|jgi:small subunit ribosomal protein S20|nr:ribosomal protein [Oscillospiraceae bacterium]
MPNIKSAKKRVKVIQTKTLRNKMISSNLKTVLKKANLAISDNTAEKAETVTLAMKKIDQACAKGLFHKNAAARKKSQLAKKFQNA